jgi:hypothetical protein
MSKVKDKINELAMNSKNKNIRKKTETVMAKLLWEKSLLSLPNPSHIQCNFRMYYHPSK